jgi:hypothetical protein
MDSGQDASWLLLSDAGRRLGLSRGALRKRIARGRIEARKGNDGLVRVLVTGDTEPGQGQDGASPVHGDGAGSVPEIVHLLSTLADARVAAARAEGECIALRAQVADLKGERDRLEVALVEARKGWLERLLEAVRRR